MSCWLILISSNASMPNGDIVWVIKCWFQLSILSGKSIRPDDILARLEGEVFGLLFTELNSAQAKIIAERMRKNVELLTGFK